MFSAFADRGVVTYKGESFIIYLAAYAQSRAIERERRPRNLGLTTIRSGSFWSPGRTAHRWCRQLERQARGRRGRQGVPRTWNDPTELRTDAAAKSPVRT